MNDSPDENRPFPDDPFVPVYEPPTTPRLGPIQTSPTVGKLFAAVAKAQGSILPIAKDRVGQVGNQQTRYSDIAGVSEAGRVPMSENGLALLQPFIADGQDVTVFTIIGHADSGEFIAWPLTMRSASATPQAIGSASTYACRYALARGMRIVSSEDDDGAAASKRNPNKEHLRMLYRRACRLMSGDDFTKLLQERWNVDTMPKLSREQVDELEAIVAEKERRARPQQHPAAAQSQQPSRAPAPAQPAQAPRPEQPPPSAQPERPQQPTPAPAAPATQEPAPAQQQPDEGSAAPKETHTQRVARVCSEFKRKGVNEITTQDGLRVWMKEQHGVDDPRDVTAKICDKMEEMIRAHDAAHPQQQAQDGAYFG